MSGGHAHGLFVHGDGPLHRLSPQPKIVATFAFAVAVVATPREAIWAFGAYVVMLAVVTVISRVPLRSVLKRLVLEVPFVAFALALPFLGEGESVEVLGISMSRSGLWAAWNILIKATLGLWATVLLAATTQIADLLAGLERLRVPRVIVGIAGFMVRFADLITGEMRRMKIARQSRAYDPRWWWQGRALVATAGTLFIRSYERGERVYLAMLSRGYSGSLPAMTSHAAQRSDWAAALAFPLVAAAIALIALTT